MRKLLICSLVLTLASACNMCSKKEDAPPESAAIPDPTATTSPAASEGHIAALAGAPPPGAAASTAKPSANALPPTSKASASVSAPEKKVPAVEPTSQLRLSRDPFRRYVDGGVPFNRYPELINVPLTSLRYVGVVRGEDGNMALLEDHAGNGHTVRVGTRVGKEGGEISEINEQEIVVKTTRKDSLGRSSTKFFRLPFYVKL